MVIIGTFQSEFINDTENQPVIASEARQSRMEIMHMFLRDCFTLFAMTFFYCVIASEAWQSHALVIASEAWQSHALVIASEAWQSRMEIMHIFLRDCFTLFAMTFFYCVIASEAR